MEWCEDDELKRQREEVSIEEDKTVRRKAEGKGLQIEGVQRVPELMVSQTLTKEKELRKKERKGKVAGWSTEKMEEKENDQLVKDRGNGEMEEHKSRGD